MKKITKKTKKLLATLKAGDRANERFTLRFAGYLTRPEGFLSSSRAARWINPLWRASAFKYGKFFGFNFSTSLLMPDPRMVSNPIFVGAPGFTYEATPAYSSLHAAKVGLERWLAMVGKALAERRRIIVVRKGRGGWWFRFELYDDSEYDDSEFYVYASPAAYKSKATARAGAFNFVERLERLFNVGILITAVSPAYRMPGMKIVFEKRRTKALGAKRK